MAIITRDKKKKRVASLMEMGVSRAAAKAALRAKGWQTDEAALIVFEDAYAEAADIPTSDEEDAGPSGTGSGTGILSGVPRSSGIDKGKQKSRDNHPKLPTPEEDESGTGGDRYGDEDDEDDGGDFDYGDDEPFLDEGATGFVSSESADAPFGDGDAYGFLDIAKDRQVEIKEVEEAVRKVIVHKTERGEFAKTEKRNVVEAEIFGLQRWLSGCPEGNEQQQLFPLYTSLAGQDLMPPKCPHKCGATIRHLESDFFAIPTSFTAYLERVSNICQTACDGCGKGVCLACNDPCDLQDPAVLDKTYTTAPNALLHCPTLQAVIIGVGLHLAGQMWDDVEAISKTIDAAAETSNSKKRKADSSNISNSRANRESYFSAGTGYGGSTSDDSGVRAAHKAQQDKDKKLAALLAQVRVYLPNRDRPGLFRDSDHMPAGQTLAHLRRRFNPIASLLLSAESLSDMSDRKDLYTEFMAWLQTMSAHENLAGLMGQPIMRAASVTLTESTNTSGKSQREKVVLFQASPGPRELLERILSQVTVAKRVASAAQLREEALRREREEANGGAPEPVMNALESELTGNNKSVETKRMIDFCETIEKAVASIDKALRQSPRGEAVLRKMQQNTASAPQNQVASSSTQKQSVKQEAISEEELKSAYVNWAKKTNYQFYDWSIEPADGASASTSNLAYKHTYTKEAAAIASHPARNTAMMKEHASLSSSLPADWSSSVFLLVDEGRPDIIKALIIGPDDTPYENGCFFFDILLGSNYNQSPPNVKSLTSKGGKHRLNPNLYAEGKVCLSLLGTWSGPGWVSGKSTLLQVLISIQSMILWSEPITNEPSFEREHKSPQSRAYNANVRRMVAHIAMLEYLVNPPEGFEEIVKTHFRLKAPALRKQLDRWIEEDDGQGLYADSMSAIRSVRYGPLGLGSALTAAVQGVTSQAVAAAAAAPAAATAIAAAAASASSSSPGTSGTSTPVAAASAGPIASSSTQSQLARDVAAIKKLLEKLEREESEGNQN